MVGTPGEGRDTDRACPSIACTSSCTAIITSCPACLGAAQSPSAVAASCSPMQLMNITETERISDRSCANAGGPKDRQNSRRQSLGRPPAGSSCGSSRGEADEVGHDALLELGTHREGHVPAQAPCQAWPPELTTPPQAPYL